MPSPTMIKQATDLLGWNLKVLSTDGSPQQVQNAWEQIVREKPDGVIYTATPRSQIDQYITQAARTAPRSPRAASSSRRPTASCGRRRRPAQAADLAKVMAAWPIVDAAKSGNTKPGAVYLNVPTSRS